MLKILIFYCSALLSRYHYIFFQRLCFCFFVKLFKYNLPRHGTLTFRSYSPPSKHISGITHRVLTKLVGFCEDRFFLKVDSPQLYTSFRTHLGYHKYVVTKMIGW